MKRDVELTAARHFLDPKSYVTPDKREICFGRDWLARKAELLARSGGRCEYVEQVGGILAGPMMQRCTAEAADPHHKIRRSVARDDRLANLLALCRMHHNLLDKRKVRSDKAERRLSGAVCHD